MELSELLNAGGIAGLIGNAITSLWVMVYAQVRRTSGATKPVAEQHLLMLLCHLLTGVALGFVFWLSWGFTAIVGVAWWQRGLIFALVTWALCCVPLASAQLLTLQVRGSVTAMIAIRWLVTFVLAGLACAWSWGHRS